MTLRDNIERAIYGTAFARQFEEDRSAAIQAGRLSGIKLEDQASALEALWLDCAEMACEYAEAVVDVHRRARKARR